MPPPIKQNSSFSSFFVSGLGLSFPSNIITHTPYFYLLLFRNKYYLFNLFYTSKYEKFNGPYHLSNEFQDNLASFLTPARFD